ncbi:MAG: hypothetical protein QXN55_08575, partial [Candidatus Nitrosotenuis sp.]
MLLKIARKRCQGRSQTAKSLNKQRQARSSNTSSSAIAKQKFQFKWNDVLIGAIEGGAFGGLGVYGKPEELANHVRPSLLKSVTRAGEAALLSQLTQYGMGLRDDLDFKSIIGTMAMTGVTVGFTQRVMQEEWQQRLFTNTFGSVMQQMISGGVNPEILAAQVLGTLAGSGLANTAKTLAQANGLHNADYARAQEASQGGQQTAKSFNKQQQNRSSNASSSAIAKQKSQGQNNAEQLDTNLRMSKMDSSFQESGMCTSSRLQQSYANTVKKLQGSSGNYGSGSMRAIDEEVDSFIDRLKHPIDGYVMPVLTTVADMHALARHPFGVTRSIFGHEASGFESLQINQTGTRLRAQVDGFSDWIRELSSGDSELVGHAITKGLINAGGILAPVGFATKMSKFSKWSIWE